MPSAVCAHERLGRMRTRGRVLAAALGLAAFVGCSGKQRPDQPLDQLLATRAATEQQTLEATRGMLHKAVVRAKAQNDRHAAGELKSAPAIDILIISGGGDFGAFAAGFLKGWNAVPADHALAKPEFAVITGVSTGALIAPFVFLGDPASLEAIDHLYRNPRKDWVKPRGWLYFLPNNISFAEVPGLERELRDNVTADLVRRIADAGSDGRVLVVNTTNLDDGTPRVFDLVAEARRATDTGEIDRFHEILLASSGIPAAFPFRMIDDQIYVDGAVTGNIIYGGRLREDQTLEAIWLREYPGVPIPKLRYWVIFNNKLTPQPQVTGANWPAVVRRSLEVSSRASTVTSLRHLLAIAEITRLRHDSEVEVRIAAIPDGWVAPVQGVFQKETMNNLADLGFKMGADPSSWVTEIP